MDGVRDDAKRTGRPEAEVEREEADAVVEDEVAGDPATAGAGQEYAEPTARRSVCQHERVRRLAGRYPGVAVVRDDVVADPGRMRCDGDDPGAGEVADGEAGDRDPVDAAQDCAGVEVEV